VTGLNFGAWAPLDEEWYLKRCGEIENGQARCINAKKWKQTVRFAGKDAVDFLSKARSLVEEFLVKNRLPTLPLPGKLPVQRLKF